MRKIKKLLCKIGWHLSYKVNSFDGASQQAKCNWCGYQGLIDSTGALF